MIGGAVSLYLLEKLQKVRMERKHKEDPAQGRQQRRRSWRRRIHMSLKARKGRGDSYRFYIYLQNHRQHHFCGDCWQKAPLLNQGARAPGWCTRRHQRFVVSYGMGVYSLQVQGVIIKIDDTGEYWLAEKSAHFKCRH